MIDPGNLTLADLLRFEIFVPLLVLLIALVKRGIPTLDGWPYLAWAVTGTGAVLMVLIALVVGQVPTPADGGTFLLRGLLAGMAACGLYDVTGGVRQRLQERAARARQVRIIGD